MPWIDRGNVTCNVGVNTTLITVPRTDFRCSFQRVGASTGTIELIGTLRWLHSLPGITPSIDTEIQSRQFWYSAAQWQLSNVRVEGRIVFWNPERLNTTRLIKVVEWVP